MKNVYPAPGPANPPASDPSSGQNACTGFSCRPSRPHRIHPPAKPPAPDPPADQNTCAGFPCQPSRPHRIRPPAKPLASASPPPDRAVCPGNGTPKNPVSQQSRGSGSRKLQETARPISGIGSRSRLPPDPERDPDSPVRLRKKEPHMPPHQFRTPDPAASGREASASPSCRRIRRIRPPDRPEAPSRKSVRQVRSRARPPEPSQGPASCGSAA